MNVYETEQALNEYLLFHYGRDADLLPYDFGPSAALGFPVRTVRNLIDQPAAPDSLDLAYDLGCAVGRSTFELANHVKTVRGFDLSSSFIGAAQALLRDGRRETLTLIEGELVERMTVMVSEPPPGAEISFAVGDAVELAQTLPPADLVLAANLICRLPTPADFLRSMARLVRPGGQLLLTTPFTWLDSFTPRASWPRDGAGNAMPSLDWMQAILQPAFVLEHKEDMPFLIREHVRKFQWTVALGMRWRRQG